MSMTDTPPHVRQRLSAIFASMSGSEKVEHALAMAAQAKIVAVAGIRSRNPGWSDEPVAAEWLRLLHGDDVAERLARWTSSS